MEPVIFESHSTHDDFIVSVIKLNAPKSLNALTLEMVHLLQAHLDEMKNNEKVVAIVLDSVIEKAFCAGGDVVSITQAWSQGNEDLGKTFFEREYTLDLTIHNYPKPIICIANGIVLGGGMGLMNGSSHRIVTETTYMAMPEISIGLFPDVGGSWFLNQLPQGMGLFLGLTAAPMNAKDATYLGLADYMITTELTQQLLTELLKADWKMPAPEAIEQVLSTLQSASVAQFAEMQSSCERHYPLIKEATEKSSITAVANGILAIDAQDKWLDKAKANLEYGSPLAAWVIHQQLQRGKGLPLKEVFAMELHMAISSLAVGDFVEGVRALLIDKDRAPQWRYATIDTVDPNHVNQFWLN